MKLLAMDFGGTFVKCCLMDENIGISNREEIPAPLNNRDQFVGLLVELFEKYQEEINGIAISMPGIIDSDSGELYSAGAYSGILSGCNLFDLLKDQVSVPVSVENDGKSAVLAETWKGTLEGVENGAAIIIGTALGGGVIMDGKLRKGAGFAAGEISGMLTVPGNYGFENLAAMGASTSALLTMVAHAKGMKPAQFEVSSLMTQELPDPDLPIYSGKDVFSWIDQGDPVTCEVYKKWLANLVQIIINMKMILDPAKIVLGGGVSRNPRLLNDVKAEYDKFMPLLTAFGVPQTEIEVCKYSADANMVGAVYNWILHNQL